MFGRVDTGSNEGDLIMYHRVSSAWECTTSTWLDLPQSARLGIPIDEQSDDDMGRSRYLGCRHLKKVTRCKVKMPTMTDGCPACMHPTIVKGYGGPTELSTNRLYTHRQYFQHAAHFIQIVAVGKRGAK